MKTYKQPRFAFVHPTRPDDRSVHSHVLVSMLGIKGKLPKGGLDKQMVQAKDRERGDTVLVPVWVVPLAERTAEEAASEGKRSNHRVRCECPGCGANVSAGRLFQHVCHRRKAIATTA